jgi:hypothetical protein
MLHREGDLPAVINVNYEGWWKNGKRHREGDLPAVIDGHRQERREWWIEGNRHRDNERPAIVSGDYKEWWVNGCFNGRKL